MKIIEKIEIKNFRSFLGSKKSTEAVVSNVKDLNIFSGSNDSGKSNILRALNLFFNDEIDSTHPFNFDTDFTVLKQKDVQKVIEIKIYFRINKRPFSISKFYDRYGYRNFEYRFLENGEEIIIDSRRSKNEERYGEKKDFKGEITQIEHPVFKKEEGYRRYALRLIYWTSFSYVPAIRDERFFKHLYGKILLQIKTNEDKKIEILEIEKDKIQNWERTLNKDNKSEKPSFKENLKDAIWRETRLAAIKELKNKSMFQQSIGELETQINKLSNELFSATKFFLDSEFKIGDSLREFFESFDIGTGKERNISLRLRGDGIQAKFIPEMLEFLNILQKEHPKKHFIWGFEEPENSAEYKNQQELAKKFKENFSKDKQIFLTTHSEEFLSIYDGKDIDEEKRTANLYHVKKVSNKEFPDFSVIILFDVDTQSFDFATVKSEIEEDIGSSLIRAKYSKELKEKEAKFLEEKRIVEKTKLESEEFYKQQIAKFNNTFPENIFICEDKNGVAIWESFFEKHGINNLKVMTSKGCTVKNIEIWISGNIKHNATYIPKVFRSLDRDGYTNEQVVFLEERLKEKNGNDLGIKNYQVKFLPVNELENFAVLSDSHFSEVLIEGNKNKLEDHFLQTASEKIKENTRFNSDLFELVKTSVIANNMKREAEIDRKKYFPGKEIVLLKTNFKTEGFLKKLSLEQYPTELKEYLDEIKLFFES